MKAAKLPVKLKKRKKSIGTKNESSLHKALKYQYTGSGGISEVEAGEFVADGITKDGEYIEVQTGSFAPLKKKVKMLASFARVRIIHPIAVKKTIEVYETSKTKKPLYRRKSPLKGSAWKLFDALLYAPELPLLKGVSIEIVLADITEKRVKDGKGSWRRKGISIFDRELSSFHESIVFKKPSDYLFFIPFKREEEFTSSLLSLKANINKDTARKVLYVLTKMKVVKRINKKGNSWIYTRNCRQS